jgi:hypothetical protein
MGPKRLTNELTFESRRIYATTRLALTLLLPIITLATTVTAAAHNALPSAGEPFLTLQATAGQCDRTLHTPLALVRMWLATRAQGLRAPCPLTATGFQPSDPPFRPITVALIQPVKTQGKNGHQLYLVRLANQTKAGTYLIDLEPHSNHHWRIDLSTQT